jgi:hypothetical protein
MKSLLSRIIGRLSPEWVEKILAHSLLYQRFASLGDVPVFEERKALWSDALSRLVPMDQPLTYVEFGVFKGESIRFFSERHSHPSSRFAGLDSFEGLPESWADMQVGAFDVGGTIPNIKDDRVRFFKGWFQDTWDNLEEWMRAAPLTNLVVHYDADLYSSTLFALCQMDRFGTSYIAVFDEFTGHETRALHNYMQAYGADVVFFSKTRLPVVGTPNQVVCRITPRVVR